MLHLEKIIKILKDGEWWTNLDEYYKIVNPEYKELCAATEITINILQELEKIGKEIEQSKI